MACLKPTEILSANVNSVLTKETALYITVKFGSVQYESFNEQAQPTLNPSSPHEKVTNGIF